LLDHRWKLSEVASCFSPLLILRMSHMLKNNFVKNTFRQKTFYVESNGKELFCN
jgi:hypothetical protein